MLAIASAFAAITGWALLDGMTTTAGSRTGYGAAIALLLPVGCGYLLIRCIRRRRSVLAALER